VDHSADQLDVAAADRATITIVKVSDRMTRPTCAISGCRTSTTPISISSAYANEAIRRLARGDRRGGMAEGARHRPRVFRWADLFGEQQIERLYFAQNNSGHCRTGPRVKVDGKVPIRPKAFAQHFHVRHGSPDLRVRLHALEQIGQLELQPPSPEGKRISWSHPPGSNRRPADYETIRVKSHL